MSSLTINQNRHGAGTVFIQLAAHHAFQVELDMAVFIVVGKAVCSRLSRHSAVADDDGIVALGDEVNALNGEITLFIRILIRTVIHGRDDYLVKAFQNDITAVEREIATVGSLHNSGVHQSVTLIEGNKRLFG